MKKRIKEGYDRYFVAIVPPEPVQNEIHEMKQVMCNQFNSCASLNSPPHITLHMPFLWKQKKRQELLDFFQNLTLKNTSFSLDVIKVDSFSNRVIFLGLEKSDPLKEFQSGLILAMKRKLNLFNAAYKDRPFHPHITLAFRDLKKQYFNEAFLYFEKEAYQRSFLVEAYTLLKHDGINWQVEKNYLI